MKIYSIFLTFILLLAGCGTLAEPAPAPTPSTATIDTDLVAHGIEIYKQQYCGICHQLTSANTTGMFGPSHDGVGTIATRRIQQANYVGSATNAEDYLMESLLYPQLFTVDGFGASSHQMPAYTFLSSEDLDALVYMLRHQE